MSNRTKEVLIVSVAASLLTVVSIAMVLAAGGGGFAQRLSVANCQPLHSATTKIQVSLSDGAGMMDGSLSMVSLAANVNSVHSGQVTFIATNYGRMIHELLILPEPTTGPGTRPTGADGKIDESLSLGEASRSCGNAAGSGISPGSRSWVTLNLAPGTYELLCDVPWHYVNGMFTTLVVR